MSFDLGDVVPLTFTTTDSTGAPADAGSVTLTVTLPDGTTEVTPGVSSTSPGLYEHAYATVQAGLHLVRWVATGANAGAYTDVVDVQAVGEVFISFIDAKEHLKKMGATADDEKLRGFVASACSAIKDRMGQVVPVTVVADRPIRRGTVVLPTRPVIAVISVVRLPGGETVPPADELAGVEGWTLESAEGVLTVPGCGRVRVTWRAGRSPLPQNFRLAGLELIGHLWRTSQLNASGGRPAVPSDEMVVPGVSFALPYNVRQLLGLDKRPQEEIPVA